MYFSVGKPDLKTLRSVNDQTQQAYIDSPEICNFRLKNILPLFQTPQQRENQLISAFLSLTLTSDLQGKTLFKDSCQFIKTDIIAQNYQQLLGWAQLTAKLAANSHFG